MLTIAVVIPAHNEADYIGPILETVRHQTRMPDEVVVVCDRCTDDTAERAKRAFASFPSTTRCLTVDADAGDIGGARNAGIRATVSEVLVCVDSDTLLHRNALHRVEEECRRGAILGGFRMVPDERFRRHPGQRLLNHLWITGINLCARTLRNFVGTGCFFRRDLNLLYDDQWGWGEDIEFCTRVKRHHRGRIVCLQDVTLVYCDRRFLERGYRKELRRRLIKGLDHLRRQHRVRRNRPAH
ncbi:MAG: glycosyltransferase family 2 protein [Capsulimonadales bacterium]|nr:glycosyltransferase family 2 protein [Capsulimonadales bacterium]